MRARRTTGESGRRWRTVGLVAGLMLALSARAADTPPAAASAPAPAIARLPQEHDYQQTLRAFMATLTEKDFAHGVTNDLTAPPGSTDPEVQYRTHIYTLMPQPLVGTKRGVPAINAPAALFTLSALETTNGVLRVPVYPETLISFVQWNYPGNPYHNNRALKLRAFVAAAVNLTMLDAHLDKTPTLHRSDWMGYQLICSGASYLGFKDVLTPEVRTAYEAGLKKLGRRLIAWGPRGEEPNLDLAAPVGLWYAARACQDTEFLREVEAYARKLLTDPRYFHPAGYYVERGGLDLGFAGMANYFAAWLALASDWPFAKEAVERAYRLRAHLCLPEPDGKLTSPTHFNARTGSDAIRDQWDFAPRDLGAAMLTDEAAYWTKLPVEAELSNAAPARAGAFNGQIHENPKGADGQFMANADIRNSPWAYHMWPSWNFPNSVNFAYEFYKPGAYAHRLELEKIQAPCLQSPFLRPGAFVTNLADAFIVAKQASYAAILHVGPVGGQDPKDGLFQFNGPLGFGGGQLSAFWTPSGGSVILGRRRGMHWEKNFDTLEDWRLWPIHAVSGCTPDGKVFTSARILRPDVTNTLDGKGGMVRVSGALTGDPLGRTNVLQGALAYTRTFQLGPKGVRVETRVTADGKDTASELVETLPVFLRDANLNTNVAVTIEFQVGKKWTPAGDAYTEKVRAVRVTRFYASTAGVEATMRVTRFAGAIVVTFDQPRRVKLAPAEWTDTFLTRAICRNLMIDLLESGDKPALIKEAGVSYAIEPGADH